MHQPDNATSALDVPNLGFSRPRHSFCNGILAAARTRAAHHGGTAADTLKAGLNSTKLTGGAGADSFDVSTAVTGATTVANITTITDFTKGDKIVFASASAFTATKVDLTGVTTEQAAIDALVAGNNSDLKWGVYNGNTYLVDDVDSGATMAATDVVVKLTGVLDLSASTVASNTLTFA